MNNLEKGNHYKVDISGYEEGITPLWLQWIPKGSFTMGCSEDERNFKRGINHELLVDFPDGFWLGRYIITEWQWQTILDGSLPESVNVNKPVVNVDWNEASHFCIELSKLLKNRIPENYVVRLPTETEWEYTYKIGKHKNEYQKNIDRRAWHNQNTTRLMDVGLKESEPSGVYDMQGNVLEWCFDSGGYFRPTTRATNYVSKYDEKRHVRGGSYQSPLSNFFYFHCEGDSYPTDTKRKYLGFRVCIGIQL